MIAPLRARHRAIFLALALLVPAGLAAALLARHERAEATSALRPESDASAAVRGALHPEAVAPSAQRQLWERAPLLGGTIGRARLLARVDDEGATTGLSLELSAVAPAAAPDVLLYWSAQSSVAVGEAEALPADARLLGALGGGGRLLLPVPDEAAGGGALLLYSLGHARLIGRAALPAAEEGDR